MKGWRLHYFALWFAAIFPPKPFPSSPFHTLETGFLTLSTAGCFYIDLKCFLFGSVSQWGIRKSGLKSPWGSHIRHLHPHWVPYLVPRSWQVLFEPCPLRTAFPWYCNLNVKCHPPSQRYEHLFPSWGLTLSGIYLEEQGHWLGWGAVESREVSLPGPICCSFSTSLLWM